LFKNGLLLLPSTVPLCASNLGFLRWQYPSISLLTRFTPTLDQHTTNTLRHRHRAAGSFRLPMLVECPPAIPNKRHAFPFYSGVFFGQKSGGRGIMRAAAVSSLAGRPKTGRWKNEEPSSLKIRTAEVWRMPFALK